MFRLAPRTRVMATELHTIHQGVVKETTAGQGGSHRSTNTKGEERERGGMIRLQSSINNGSNAVPCSQ